MKNSIEIPAYFFLKKINNFDLNLDFLNEIIIFLIKDKKLFFLNSKLFLALLKEKIVKYSINFKFKEIIFSFLKNCELSLNYKNYLKIYDKLILFFFSILNLSKKFLVLFKISKNLNSEKKKDLENILKKYSLNVSIIIEKIDENLYSGFQIYFKEIRVESNYRRISNDLFNIIEKNIWS